MLARDFTLRPATTDDADAIVAINQASVQVTSPLDSGRFNALLGECARVIVAETERGVVGFLMAFAEGADYANDNFRWFSERLRRFVYVDRVVVASAFRGVGVGRAFYADLDSWARQSAHLSIVAEVDLQPPNHGSLRFHEKAGFTKIGTRLLPTQKTVSMLLRTI